MHKHSNTKSNTTTLTAVALQDHWMRSLSLSDPTRPKNIPQKKINWKKNAKPIVDTGRAKPQKKEQKLENKEYVLDALPPPLTLAQRMGIFEKPQQLLSESEWQTVKQQSNERDDSSQPCVICKEDFGLDVQVLLSCTHVFHKNCLEAFERFSGKKSCPMCRKEQYQKRVIHEGAKEYRVKCATRIQATWRGYVVRCWYKKLRHSVPPKDPNLRKKFYEDKLHAITDRMVRSLDTDVNAFLREIDQSVEASRDVVRHLDNVLHIMSEDEWEVIQLKAVERGKTDCPICLTPLESQGITKEDTIAAEPTAPPVAIETKSTRPKNHREKVKLLPKPPKTANTKKITKDVTDKEGQGDTVHENVCRRRILLSCSHVFHQTCLEAFEEFAEGDRKFVCPVCRTRYQKKIL